MDAIVIENLTKVFRPSWPGRPSVQALAGLSITVQQGAICGFLGPNGSGKTTTLKILMGLMRPTSGMAEVLGRPAGDVKVRQHIGFLPESPYFYEYLTAEEFLRFYGHLSGVRGAPLRRRVDELLDLVGLGEARARQLRKFSKGMLQRVGLAQALVHDPQLVILDEPMSGLDPLGRKQVRDLILGLRDQGKTVFFSSHIIPDVEMICDQVGIIVRGRLLAMGRVEDLVSHGHTQSVEVVCEGGRLNEMKALEELAARVVRRGQHLLIVLPGHERLEELLELLRRAGASLISVTPQKGSLEELFLRQTGPGEVHSKPPGCWKTEP